MSDYNYSSFTPDYYDFVNSAGPDIGQVAPNFELETTDGNKKFLLDFEGDFLVLELGSITCPLFHTRREGMQSIQRDFPQISFAVLYVREAHPGETIPSHKNFEYKKSCAVRLVTEDGDSRTIFIDDINGTAHQAYGSLPNAVFIIDKENVVGFKAEWNNPSATRVALSDLIDGKKVCVKSYFLPAKPSIVLSTASRAGKGSAADFFRGLPQLIWNNLIKLNIRTLLKKSS